MKNVAAVIVFVIAMAAVVIAVMSLNAARCNDISVQTGSITKYSMLTGCYKWNGATWERYYLD